MLERADPTATLPPRSELAPLTSANLPVHTAADPLWLRTLLWAAIGLYILTIGNWAYRKGMQIRDDTWVNTRTIRFHGDIQNGIRWGSLVIRAAERVANSSEYKKTLDPKIAKLTARANPTPGDRNERALTLSELYRGEDQVYKEFVDSESADGNFGLDYPPMRLFVMTLWTRQVRNHYPDIQQWPGRYQIDYSATADPAVLVSEDIARPVLLANTYSIAAAAVIAFFLVWIWVNRGGRPALPQQRRGWTAWFAPKRLLVPWQPVPLRNIKGLALFAITAAAFFYAVTVAENPTPAPPPSIAIAGRPILSQSSKGTVTAVISATIDGQGSDAQWYVDWGTTASYGHQTSADAAGGDDVSTSLRDLPAKTTIHYRINARSDRGITHTDDVTFNTADRVTPAPSGRVYGAVWLNWKQWLGVAILFVAMAAALRMLPPVHRGWAAGLVAALLMWFDPAVIVDTHIWPQWDAWVLPPFLLAALMATLDWWFVAGLVLGVGVMFKGQTMVASPILMLWPLFSGRWGALGRIITGFVLAAGLVLFPWLVLDNKPAVWTVGPMRWILGVGCAAVVAGAVSLYRGPAWRRWLGVWDELKSEWNGTSPPGDAVASPPPPATQKPQTSITELVIFGISLLAGIVIPTFLVLKRWPGDLAIIQDGGPTKAIAGFALLLAILIVPWLLPRRALGVFLAGVIAASIWMSAYLYQGDWTWKTVGFEYGTRKFTRMALGNGQNGNLGQILESRFGWDVHDPAFTLRLPDIAHTLHLGTQAANGAITGWAHDWGFDGTPATLDIRQFLMLVFVTMLVLVGFGASRHARRNDPRLLACLAAIWMVMPNTLCQMANRYEMWGAALSSMLIAISPGLTLLHIVFSLLGAGMIGAQLLNSDPSRSPLIHDLMTRFGPDDGWIMLTIAAVFLYVAIAPGRPAEKQELLPL